MKHNSLVLGFVETKTKNKYILLLVGRAPFQLSMMRSDQLLKVASV